METMQVDEILETILREDYVPQEKRVVGMLVYHFEREREPGSVHPVSTAYLSSYQ
jgi:hypothetical protein